MAVLTGSRSSLCDRFDQCSVAILVVAVLVAKSFVSILGVAILECGRFDQDPLGQ